MTYRHPETMKFISQEEAEKLGLVDSPPPASVPNNDQDDSDLFPIAIKQTQEAADAEVSRLKGLYPSNKYVVVPGTTQRKVSGELIDVVVFRVCSVASE